MKKQVEITKGKIISVWALYILSIVIIISGTIFSLYSLKFNVSMPVFNSTIPGIIFGIVIIFLGVRYLLSVRKLKAEVYKKSSKFSWSNFKRKKKLSRAK